jgi:hypothetical protein
MTVLMIADELQIGKTSVPSILTEASKLERSVPRLYQNCSLLSKSCEENNVALTGKP